MCATKWDDADTGDFSNLTLPLIIGAETANCPIVGIRARMAPSEGMRAVPITSMEAMTTYRVGSAVMAHARTVRLPTVLLLFRILHDLAQRVLVTRHHLDGIISNDSI